MGCLRCFVFRVLVVFIFLNENVRGRYGMKTANRRVAASAEVLFLCVVLFCLPLFEGPKNVFSALFLIAWVIQAVRTNSLGANCIFNWPVVGLAAVLWLAPLFSVYGDTITPLNSAPRWTLLALFVIAAARLDYTRNHLLIM